MSFLTDPNLDTRVALGLVPGWRWFRKFGSNDTVGTSGVEDCWPPGTVRVLPTSAYVAVVSSTDVNDDPLHAAPTGAWTVTIQGLDSLYDEISETVTLNGTTQVQTLKTFLRINRAYVTTAGTSEWNEGDISITLNSVLQGFIASTQGQTSQVMYTVPRNHQWLITNYHVKIGRMTGATDAQVMGGIRTFGGAWRVISDIYLYGPDDWSAPAGNTLVPAKTDLRVQILSSGATELSAAVSGYLIKTERQDI